MFRAEQLSAVIGQWERLRQDLDEDRVLAIGAANAQVAPAEEAASWRISRGNDAMWEAFIEHNRAMSRFANVYLAELTGVRDAYLEREQRAANDFNRR